MSPASPCTSGKIIYRSQQRANRVISAMRRRGAGVAVPYKCAFCGYWHLTTAHRNRPR